MAAPGHSFDQTLSGLDPHKLRQHDTASPRAKSPTAGNPRHSAQYHPIDDAVNDALHKAAEPSSSIPPDLIAQITQNVIQHFQSVGLETSTPVPTQNGIHPPPPAPPPEQQPVPTSPSTTNSGTSPTMPGRVFTPPSPQKHTDFVDRTSPILQSGQVPEPSNSPSRGLRNPGAFSPNRSVSPMSQASDISDMAGERPLRPKGPSRLHTGKEETTLEKIWGALFQEDGRSTLRLSQFLRGLAIHIIEDCEPKHSIVITPDKMVKYYETVKLENEIYPWSIVFDDERSSISRMYRELSCQHHLVQENFDERPDIPGLTPKGFERWVELLIRANPEAEFERLAKALLHMPINNPDDKKERFPKEITRRLFPKHGDLETRYTVEDAMMEHASIEIPRPKQRSMDDLKQGEESPPQKPSVDVPTGQGQRHGVQFADQPDIINDQPSTLAPSSAIERERAPYSTVPENAMVDDTNPSEPPPSKPIERERKPYVAQAGGGRQYENDEVRPREGSTRPRGDSVAVDNPKPSRSDSTATRARPIPINPNHQQIPKPQIHQHYRNGSNANNTHRRRSPSFSQGSDYRRPDSDFHGYRPSVVEPSSVPRSGSEQPFDDSDPTKRYFDNLARERARRDRDREEDARQYGESPRRSRRANHGNEEEYLRSRDRRDRAYDDGYHREPYGSSYR